MRRVDWRYDEMMNRLIAPVQVRHLGRQDYLPTWARMRAFTDSRDATTADELWLTEHNAVYTLGQAGRVEQVHDAGSTPVIRSDRGGQVTYHGPGQVIVYTLLDLRRLGIGIRQLVSGLEGAVIALLASQGLCGERREGAPGVYVAGAKVAALGLRVRRGCTYHGIAFNVDPELSKRLRAISAERRESLNATVLHILRAAVGLDERRERLQRYTTWNESDVEEFDAALAAQRVVDERYWK